MLCDDVDGNDRGVGKKFMASLDLPSGTNFRDIYGHIGFGVKEGGKDAHPVWVCGTAEDIVARDDVDSNPTIPGFLQENDVSLISVRGGYVK